MTMPLRSPAWIFDVCTDPEDLCRSLSPGDEKGACAVVDP